MTSIAISTNEQGTISCSPIVEPEECYALVVCTRFEQAMRFSLDPATCEELGEALVKIGKELTGRKALG